MTHTDLERAPRVQSSRTSFHANIHSRCNSISSDPLTQAPQSPASMPQQQNMSLRAQLGFFELPALGTQTLALLPGQAVAHRAREIETSRREGSGSVDQRRSRSGAREGQSLNSNSSIGSIYPKQVAVKKESGIRAVEESNGCGGRT